jgi:drug/metabolite transporter (DMT)-like permease
MHSISPTVLGIALMTCAMLSVPLVDGIAKHLSSSYSPLYLVFARYAIATLIVLPLAALTRPRPLFPPERRMSHLLRTIALMAATSLYFLAIARIPLATAVSAFFIGPVVAVALAVVVLKERITGAKIASLVLGFVGAIVILRPGAVIEPGILLALGSGVCFAIYLVATRQASQVSDPIKTLAFQCMVGALVSAPQAIATWSVPAWSDALLFAALGGISVVSHLLSIAAFRHADASTLSPLVYLELIGAVLVGYFAFGDIPDATTIAGAALIVAASALLLERGKQMRTSKA